MAARSKSGGPATSLQLQERSTKELDGEGEKGGKTQTAERPAAVHVHVLRLLTETQIYSVLNTPNKNLLRIFCHFYAITGKGSQKVVRA